ncbi:MULTISPECIES: acyl-CoA dehydrogenase [unclassified Microbacterium]|uniref:acyl-CoA dehydrogenase n=1 Tax=unclassified Microbacterium TaxID=2609290 RepID=UPI00386D5FA1
MPEPLDTHAFDPTSIVPSAGAGLAMDAAASLARRLPRPGEGDTLRLWDGLAAIAAHDVEAARMIEPHLDAQAILSEARAAGHDLSLLREQLGATDDSTWGVYAAEGPGEGVAADRADDDSWTLSGTKPWCSLAAHLTHALVTAWTGDGARRLFAVDLRSAGVRAHAGPWVARGLRGVVSAPVDFAQVRAVPVGGPGWYLDRPGFSWGGIGVAAIWWGAARPLVTAVKRAAGSARADQLATYFAGEADAADWTARLALERAAREVDAGSTGDDAKVLAARTRIVIATATEQILSVSDRALGPAPLTTDEAHAKRVADLRLYLRQHHAERDTARLGRLGLVA